ncbi:MAG: FAD-dependent oxidoreductase [Clostridiales bacterium]|nr:FAD-dependent oxidoreductase [Candidatus Apopatocola equi]
MIEVKEIQQGLDETLEHAVAKKLKIAEKDVLRAELLRRGVDARHKDRVHFVASAAVQLRKGEEKYTPYTPYTPPQVHVLREKPKLRPVVVGAGPAGLFAALTLARSGAEPLLIEQGDCVEERQRAVKAFTLTGRLDPDSNIQFGEGVAGAFSDGKLNSGTHDVRGRQVLRELAAAGAPEEILWEAKPHIGTDRLPAAVAGLREAIKAAGGEVRFRTPLRDLVIENGAVRAIVTDREEIPAERVILAAGHSARALFYMLRERGAELIRKPFSIGVRCEHPQSLINESQYGAFAAHPALGAADYKLAVHLPTGRDVYSFCMCPGGEVAAASSEEGRLCVNGMSPFARDGRNANSALLVNVQPSDFPGASPLAGIEFQRHWEEAAFRLGGGLYRAPAQLVEDFLLGRPSEQGGSVKPTYPLGVRWCDLSECLPTFASASLRDAFPLFERKIRGFAMGDAVLTGIEARSSSPVRIVRNETGESNLRGLYPTGEGAGYAGGILSAAVDGIRQAERVLDSYQ